MDAPARADPTSTHKATLEALSSERWEEILKELFAYTLSRLQNRFWLGVWSGHLPGGAEARDIVMESIGDVIAGVRRAGPEVDLVAFLKQVIRSKISHLVRSAENRRTERLDPMSSDKELDQEIANRRPEALIADTEVVSREAEEINSRLLSLLIDELSAEPDLQRIIECNLEGIFKREDIATRLGKTPSEVTNMKKRLDRRLAEFRIKYASENPYTEPVINERTRQ
jgi:RNA polymerase sigma factor (sigma-70 family)